MGTNVIIRADDITGERLRYTGRWFRKFHPDVPCTGFATGPNPHWTQEDWEVALDLIVDFGWELGGHTVTHPMLPTLDSADIRREIRDNKEFIENGLASAGLEYSLQSFAYPTGSYDNRVIDILQEEGYACGLTYPDGFPYRSCDGIPMGRDRYTWGITHNAFLGVDEWNDRFDRVDQSHQLYIFCLHPPWWWDTSNEPDSIGEDFEQGWADQWNQFNDHLHYIKQADDVNFITVRQALGY